MKCGIGDKVRFLNEVGGGTVIRMIDKRTVAIKTDDGFEIPTLISELVVVASSSDKLLSINKDVNEDMNKSHRSKSNEKIIKSEVVDVVKPYSTLEEVDPQGSNISLLLAFVPENKNKLNDCNQVLYLINDGVYKVFYSICNWQNDKLVQIVNGLLNPDSKEVIKIYESKSLNKQLDFNIQLLFFKNIPFTLQQPDIIDISISPIKLNKPNSFVENDYFEEDAFILTLTDNTKELIDNQLTDSVIESSIKQKDLKVEVKTKNNQNPEIEEVDLHIQELVENSNGMTAGEIIQVQLARFETALEGRIRNGKTKKIVFIHGLGNGKLKHEVRKLLDTKYKKYKYQDASFKEYGYGATMVYLR